MTRDEARRILLAGGEVKLDGLFYRFQDGWLEYRREWVSSEYGGDIWLEYRREWVSSEYGGDIEAFLRDSFPGPRSPEEIDAEIAELEDRIAALKAERGEA